MNQEVLGSIPGQGICLGFGLVLIIDISISIFLSEINNNNKKDCAGK